MKDINKRAENWSKEKLSRAVLKPGIETNRSQIALPHNIFTYTCNLNWRPLERKRCCFTSVTNSSTNEKQPFRAMKKRKKFKRENSSAMRAHWTYKRNAHFFLYPPNKCSHNDSTCTDEQREGKKQQQQRTATHRKFPKCNACRTNAIRIWSRIWSTFTCTRKTFSRKYNPLQSSSFSCYLCENEWHKKSVCECKMQTQD